MDPVLYARIILLLQRGERRQAIQAVQEELELDAPAATAMVDQLWKQYQAEIPPTDLVPRRRRLTLELAVILAAVASILGWVLWHGLR